MDRGLTRTAVTSIRHFVALTMGLMIVASSAKPYESSTSVSSPEVLRSDSPPDQPIITSRKEEKMKRKARCFTPECCRTASRILKNMNQEIRPCDDFYKFVCGGFEKSTTIPADKSNVNVFSHIHDKLRRQLKASITEPSEPGELRSFTLAKNFYKSCKNRSAIKTAGLEPLRKILRQVGNWPVIEGVNWKEEEFHWTTSVHKLQKHGCSMDYFIGLGVDVEPKNGTRHVLFLDVPSLGLSREYLTKGLEDKVVKAYFDYMVDVAVILGATRQRAIQELKESLKFECQLANISLPSEERRDPTLLYNPVTIAELKERHPAVDWKEYVNGLLPPSVRIDDDEVVIVRELSFVRDLMELLRTTPKRVQANYVMWRVVGDSVKYLTNEIRKRQLLYHKELLGKTKNEARWKECIALVADGLPISTGALYVREHFNEEAKETVVEMVADIRKEFRKILEENEWMDEKTRSKALEKAASMSSHIAYPDELFDDKKLEEFHTPLELRPDDLFGNVQNVSLFGTMISLEKLRKPVNKSEWTSHGGSAVVNAFYSQTENSIQFPAGILQGAFFSNDRPQYMNYGAIGLVIGHEITHGFDDQGKQYDKEGNLVDWWAPETKEKYLKKAECIINQYGNYTAESVGLNLNGINTQGENIADNGGLKEAYRAYKEWVKRNGPEPRLPGLNYTQEQMFWISFANTGCTKYRPQELKLRILTDAHSPGEFRVIGSVSNMPEFAEDFNCPVGSAMDVKERCSVW